MLSAGWVRAECKYTAQLDQSSVQINRRVIFGCKLRLLCFLVAFSFLAHEFLHLRVDVFLIGTHTFKELEKIAVGG